MNETQRSLLEAFDPSLPLERAKTIPPVWAADSGLSSAEREKIFSDTWLAAGRVDQLAASGSFVTLDVAGLPILLVRDGDKIGAFFNVCRHRAAPLLTEPCGSVTRLRCR